MADSDEPRRPSGLGAALSELAANAIALLRTRLELASVELQEATGHVKQLVVLAIVGALLAIFTLLFASIFVIVCFWDTHPLAAVGGVTLFYLALTVAAFQMVAPLFGKRITRWVRIATVAYAVYRIVRSRRSED